MQDSRIPVYCHCSDSNRSDTVLQLFLQAVRKYGLPSRVCCDKGTENYGVAYFMLNHPERGTGRGSVIAGRSVHNQRVERFWRDVFVSCVCVFYHLFYHLEDTGLLDPTNDLDIFSLHFVYIPYSINEAVSPWMLGVITLWDHLPIEHQPSCGFRGVLLQAIGLLINSMVIQTWTL